jgi:hypothetical protein
MFAMLSIKAFKELWQKWRRRYLRNQLEGATLD